MSGGLNGGERRGTSGYTGSCSRTRVQGYVESVCVMRFECSFFLDSLDWNGAGVGVGVVDKWRRGKPLGRARKTLGASDDGLHGRPFWRFCSLVGV